MTPPVVEYIALESSPREALTRIMNDARVRKHLAGQRSFTPQSLEAWIEMKSERIRRDPRCRINGILVDGEYAGWCGIQQEDDGTYGLGIILAPRHWGCGPVVFDDMVQWSRELGHREVFIHLLTTRRMSKALMRRLETDCETVEMLGKTFRRYRVSLTDRGLHHPMRRA